MITYKKKSTKISKGYRLEPETHALVIKMCKLLKVDQNEAVKAAFNALIKSTEKSKYIKRNNIF